MRKLLLVLLLVVYPAYGQDYTVTPVEVKPPLENMNITGGTNLNLADDGMANNINIGFDFEFYGNTFNKVNISNNGFITFTGLNSMCCQGNLLPSFGMDNSIMALWTDLISINNVNPYYKTVGELGSRYFTVGWYDTLEFYNTDATNTFEIKLYEGSNNILFNYEKLNVFGHSLTAGIQGTDGQSEQIYHGNSTQSLANSAYLFTYTPPEPIKLTAPDCSTNPADINCIIKLNANTIYSEPTTIEDINRISISSQTPDPTTEQQVLGGVPPDLETLLGMTTQQSDGSQQEKEEELKDNIDQNILELALMAAMPPEQNSEQERNNRNSGNISDESSGSTSQQTSMPMQVSTSDNQESQSNNDNTIDQKDETLDLIMISQLTEEQIIEQDQGSTDVGIEILAQAPQVTSDDKQESDNNGIINDDGTVNEEKYIAQQLENTNNDQSVIEETVIASSSKSVESTNEDDEVLKIVANSQKSTFKEEEEDSSITEVVMVPMINNVAGVVPMFNVDINMADKERLGLVNKTQDRKSDAEKRAEQVIAANKDQQDQINKDYMNADQSGILGAIASDTDVSAYRTANIPQNVSWYKTEEIYKKVIYRDNVRGAYFLEKGNTDTYKKMVEEQYKK